jgi:20S proteasome subunit beta 3
VGLPGLATDVQTLSAQLSFRMNLFKLREEREMRPSTFGHMVSAIMYEKRFGPYFIEPVVAGLEEVKEDTAVAEGGKTGEAAMEEEEGGSQSVVAVGKRYRPFITAMDVIGAEVFTDDFVVAGTCSENLYGMCESLYKKDMEPDELFEVVSQALLSAVDRDAMSGWGAVVHVITPEGVRTRHLKARVD